MSFVYAHDPYSFEGPIQYSRGSKVSPRIVFGNVVHDMANGFSWADIVDAVMPIDDLVSPLVDSLGDPNSMSDCDRDWVGDGVASTTASIASGTLDEEQGHSNSSNDTLEDQPLALQMNDAASVRGRPFTSAERLFMKHANEYLKSLQQSDFLETLMPKFAQLPGFARAIPGRHRGAKVLDLFRRAPGLFKLVDLGGNKWKVGMPNDPVSDANDLAVEEARRRKHEYWSCLLRRSFGDATTTIYDRFVETYNSEASPPYRLMPRGNFKKFVERHPEFQINQQTFDVTYRTGH